MSRLTEWHERFWSKVEKTETCWVWRGGLDENGYGRFILRCDNLLAHRIAFVLVNGPIPVNRSDLDHLCKVRQCVNPDHLEAVTPTENWKRGNAISAMESRRTHCIRGHALSGDNLIRQARRRRCRTCDRARKDRKNAQRRAKREASRGSQV